MLALGWGLAAVLGAVAGMMAAPALVFLDPNMMQTVLLYAFAAAVLGGLDSPLGAVVGGAPARRDDQPARRLRRAGSARRCGRRSRWRVILVVLLVRPAGLFGRTRGEAGMMRRALGIALWVLVVAAGIAFFAVLPRFVSDFHARELAIGGHVLHRDRSA